MVVAQECRTEPAVAAAGARTTRRQKRLMEGTMALRLVLPLRCFPRLQAPVAGAKVRVRSAFGARGLSSLKHPLSLLSFVWQREKAVWRRVKVRRNEFAEYDKVQNDIPLWSLHAVFFFMAEHSSE